MATRRERVVLDLQSNLTPVMTSDAAAARILDASLDELGRTSKTTVRDLHPLGEPNGPIGATGSRSRQTSREIDRLSGRLKLVTDLVGILGPGMVPIAAVGIPALAALATQAGAAALAGGTIIASFQGVGEALKAVDKAALEPTAENLEAARIAMQKIGPEARSLVRELRAFQPVLLGLRNAGAAGLFPGLERSLVDLERLSPRLERLLYVVGDSVGDLVAGGADSLAGPRWQAFMQFLRVEMPDVLTSLGHILGDITHGLAGLWMAFRPLNDDFAGWMLRGADAFDKWANGLAKTEGFEDFVTYIRQNGPIVGEAIGSIANALVQIVSAAAPLGGPVLQALTGIADALALIAGSPAGPTIMAAVTALALLSRTTKAWGRVSQAEWVSNIRSADTYSKKMQAARGPLAKGAGALAGFGIAATGAADSLGLTNTAAGALMGTIGGPWGAAVGGAVGMALDFADSQNQVHEKATEVAETLNQQTGAITANTREWVKNELYTSGAFEAAERLGIDLATVTDAALGNADALSAVNTQLERKIALTTEDPRALAGDEGLRQINEDATGLQSTLNGANAALVEGRDKVRQFGEAGSNAAGRVEQGFDQATSSAALFRAEIERVNELLSDRASFRDYEAALDDFAETMKGIKNPEKLLGPKGRINISLPKGREVQEQLDNIAQTALKVAENLKGADRVRYLQRARRDFVNAAALILKNRDAAQDLADKLGLVGRQRPKPKIELDGWANAIDQLGAVRTGIDNIPRYVPVTVHVARTGAGLDFLSGGQRDFHTGGYTGPGRKYDVAGRVHAGEWVFEKELVDSNRAAIEGFHRQLRASARAGRARAVQSYGSRGHATARGTTAVRERVIERLPSGPVVLQIEGGGRFRAWIREQAHQVADDRASTRRRFDRLVRGE